MAIGLHPRLSLSSSFGTAIPRPDNAFALYVAFLDTDIARAMITDGPKPYEGPTGPEWSNGSAQTADEHGASGTNGGASASNAVTDVEYNNGEHMVSRLLMPLERPAGRAIPTLTIGRAIPSPKSSTAVETLPT
jgi:hypothetical protein